MKAWNTERRFLTLLFLTTVLFVCVGISTAQPVLPLRTLTLTPTQAIHFGTFCTTGGETSKFITVDCTGSRTASNGIMLLSSAPTAQPAIFELKLCEGRNVNIAIVPSVTLTGSNGGPSFTLDLGPTEKGEIGTPFSTNNDCNFVTILRVGGTLHVPGTAVSGAFSGSFAITFNQE